MTEPQGFRVYEGLYRENEIIVSCLMSPCIGINVNSMLWSLQCIKM